MIEHPLHPRARLLFHLQAMIRWVIVGIPISIGTIAFSTLVIPLTWAIAAGLIVGGATLVWSLWSPTLQYQAWMYGVSDDELVIRHGVLVRRMVTIPMVRVQHIDTIRTPLDRILGLNRLYVYTASGQGADGVIPGLMVEEAAELRAALVRVSNDDGV